MFDVCWVFKSWCRPGHWLRTREGMKWHVSDEIFKGKTYGCSGLSDLFNRLCHSLYNSVLVAFAKSYVNFYWSTLLRWWKSYVSTPRRSKDIIFPMKNTTSPDGVLNALIRNYYNYCCLSAKTTNFSFFWHAKGKYSMLFDIPRDGGGTKGRRGCYSQIRLL